MNRKFLSVVFALLALTAFASAQNFVACIYDDSLTLTTTCGGSTPLPEGTMMTVYYDANSNGPDASDQPGTVCDQPPDCPSGPPGTLNMNQSPINGVAQGIGAGMFLTDPCLTSSGITPSPARYYLVINYPANHPTIKWTSSVFTVAVGPQDVRLVNWTCEVVGTPVECTPTRHISFTPNPPVGNQDQDTCAHLCMDSITTICVGPIPNASRFPVVRIFAGCLNDTCMPAAGWVFDTTMWQFTQQNNNNYYCNTISLGPNGVPGCVTVDLDFVLPVEMGNVAITPGDNAVNVAWTTRSENSISRFEIVRNGKLIGFRDATNSPTGHEYSYVDESALNGTSYTYNLVVINADGSSQTVATQAVTPSAEHALVTEYSLRQNYPNPFNPTTSIRYDLVEKNFVTLKIFNITGQEVATLVNGERAAGVNIANFDATTLTSGLYFYTIKIGNVYSATKKMMLLK
ncbi:MAG TPA: T9SS type A sorting domain-containing protein [bacterium]|jgi:hypothetical protein